MIQPELTKENCGGKWYKVIARNPETVCASESLMVAAMRAVGILPHPAPGFAFRVLSDENGVFWRWVVSAKSADGLYEAKLLEKWWNDPAWRRDNPMHEWTILHNGLVTLARQAAEIRDSIPHLVVREGNGEAHIPMNASPARHAHLLAKLRREIPLDTVFVEPQKDEAAA